MWLPRVSVNLRSCLRTVALRLAAALWSLPLCAQVPFTDVQQVATGDFHSCALLGDGTVRCWGSNSHGQLGDGTTSTRLVGVPVHGLSNVVAIAIGSLHSCALSNNGTVKCWGNNNEGQLGDGTTTQRLTPVTVSGLASGVVAIATGARHTCALSDMGALTCWGDNNFGQLGDNSTATRFTPVGVVGLGSGVASIAAGQYHTCAISVGATLQCWGYNSDGQLGDNSNQNRLTPVSVAGLSADIARVVTGGYHTCAVSSDGATRCWGQNTYGQVGDNTTTDRWTPVPVVGLGANPLSISLGEYHTCAVTGSGAARCWGENNYGQLGDQSRIDRLSPTAVAGVGAGAINVSAGQRHTCAILLDGSLRCWGLNSDGQLGDNSEGYRSLPVAVQGVTSAAQVAAGHRHTCALTTSGAMGCWGDGDYGQLGNGEVLQQLSPEPVSGAGGTVAQMAAGYQHTCALSGAGAARCWGDNASGQLGDGSNTDRLTPFAVSGLATGVTAIDAGVYHTCAIANGSAYCWGGNDFGQLGNGDSVDQATPVAVSGIAASVSAIEAGFYFSCALTTGGGVWCWGYNGSGQLGNGSTTQSMSPVSVSGLSTGVVAIANGYAHACALTSVGAVLCWGDNGNGQVGDGSTTDRLVPVPVAGLSAGVIAITANGLHSCALTAMGSVQCWGENADGQLGDGSTTDRLTPVTVAGLGASVTALAAGHYHTCAVINGGALRCWGDNYYGQLGDGTAGLRSIQAEAFMQGELIFGDGFE